MRTVLETWRRRGALLYVSRHTLAELAEKPDAALECARELETLPHSPIGAWSDQVATWDQVDGTWGDAKRNQALQIELETLAKSGNDIRDRGAYLDAPRAGLDVFVTSDSQLVNCGPAARIAQRFGLRVATPIQFAAELSQPEVIRIPLPNKALELTGLRPIAAW